MAITPNIPLKRAPIEDFKTKFCPQLISRLYPLVRWVSECEGEVLLLLNILDRSLGAEKDTLIYGGIKEQIKFSSKAKSIADDEGVVVAVDGLAQYSIKLGDARVAGDLFNSYSEGELELKDIPKGDLKAYFDNSEKNEQGILQHEQAHEYPIINHFFDISTDLFISLPLIQFGQFDGVVHIIFQQSDKDIFYDPKSWRQLIRHFSLEYEGLLLDWDLVGDNMEKKSAVREELDYLISEEYEKASTTNPIFKELKYRLYYIDSYDYYLTRIDQNDAVPEYLKQEHRKRAIISILIDSYAHNISAHSLTVLKWWFQQRAGNEEEISALIKEIAEHPSFKEWGIQLRDYLAERFPDAYQPKDIESGILGDLARWIQIVDRRKKGGVFLPVRDQFLPLAEQLHPLFKFLLEKGAFWSGITRDQQFGGEIRSLYDVLWHDFINNPLYLGTIAYSEGITKLNIHFRFYSGRQYKPEDYDPIAFRRVYQIDKDEASNTLLDGLFATINVGDLQDSGFSHTYVHEGPLFHLLANKLKNCEIFLPGGVVGKHALFTLMENEIRNVKHYPVADLEQMQQNGLDLYIGIRPGTLSGIDDSYKERDKQLFKIGVWLNHKTRLYDKEEHVISKRLKNLMGDIIIPETNQARLGGNFQDKICAAMLFNNNFTSVQKQKSDRDRHYYPWMRSAYSTGPEGDAEIDFEVQGRNLEEAEENLKNTTNHAQTGYFKKYFHVWQGRRLHELHHTQELEAENIARFKMVSIPDASFKKAVRENGVIRVLERQEATFTQETAYQQWLLRWLKDKKCRVKLVRESTEIGHLIFDEKAPQYINQDDYLDELSDAERNSYGDYPAFELKFAHSKTGDPGEKNILKVRSHGVLAQKFFDNLENINDFDQATITLDHLCELLEVIQTKVCIFDNRIAERVPKDKRTYLNEQLQCGIYWESRERWDKIKQEGLDKYHFIIIHLSFLEAMLDGNGKKYTEAGIDRFLKEQVGELLSDNCIFVVTTGRGREEWWKKIESDPYYSAHTTFRPVEMLIEAVETAELKSDDIDLKYNLMKVLFGS
ncbi:MAG TPA: hypothetical protein PKA00_07945 [Saprospiraceae bacterium]|nr:hypothetical protein [Saprospiraceae bacterium]HMQ82824.1 hypothetical protein [Saprospiraceae bacterium]